MILTQFQNGPWKLKINPTKSHVLQIPHSYYDFTYSVSGEEINELSSVRDLGLQVQTNLRFGEHVSIITRRAFSQSRNIRMSFKHHDCRFLISLFKTYIRPLVESNISAFSPITIDSIDKIESVQRRYTKYLPGLGSKSYRERLFVLDLVTLEERRIAIDLVFMFKMLHGKIHLDFTRFFVFANPRCRGHRYKVIGRTYRKTASGYFFVHRMANIWNDLPDEFFDSSSVDTFRDLLETSFDIKKYCCGSYFNEILRS